MIVVNLKGGLGNQMFQYAAGRALASKLGVPLLLDLSFLQSDPGGQYTQRHYELNQFNIRATLATESDLANFKGTPRGFFDKLFRKVSNYKTVNESGSSFNEDFKNLGDNVLLNGFWQSEKYFKAISEEIRRDFTPSFSFAPHDQQVISEINNNNSVSLHVRRGDYVSLKSAAEYHGTCGLDYYRAAMRKIEEANGSVKYYVFSDDLAWCKDNFKETSEITFVQSTTGASACDLLMMSYCRHNIIANSSFSWWGAWLNQNPSKTVIAPFNWFAPHVPVNNDLIPADWIRI